MAYRWGAAYLVHVLNRVELLIIGWSHDGLNAITRRVPQSGYVEKRLDAGCWRLISTSKACGLRLIEGHYEVKNVEIEGICSNVVSTHLADYS